MGRVKRMTNADQEDPRGEQELEPLVLPSSQQQSQRNQIAEVREPARVRSPTVLTESVNTAAIRMA
jgi:hypothetical protein